MQLVLPPGTQHLQLSLPHTPGMEVSSLLQDESQRPLYMEHLGVFQPHLSFGMQQVQSFPEQNLRTALPRHCSFSGMQMPPFLLHLRVVSQPQHWHPAWH